MYSSLQAFSSSLFAGHDNATTLLCTGLGLNYGLGLKVLSLPEEPFMSMARKFDALITPRTRRPSNGTYISDISNWPRFC